MPLCTHNNRIVLPFYPSHPLLKDHLLPLWEEARKADLTKDERKAAIAKLWEATKGRVAEVSRGHKGGRVLQTVSSSPGHGRRMRMLTITLQLIKFGGKEERNGVAQELDGQYKAMMSSKYSKVWLHFFVVASIYPLTFDTYHARPRTQFLIGKIIRYW